MPFPPVPRELYEPGDSAIEEQLWSCMQNISALFLYLQRVRDQSADEIATVIESDPSLAGNAFLDSSSIDFTSDINGITATVLNDSTIQKVEIAQNGVLTSVRKRLNFSGGISILDNVAENRSDISVHSGSLRRVVETSLVLNDTECIISSRYFEVQGILELIGDATLEIM